MTTSDPDDRATTDAEPAATDLRRLLDLAARLRAPDGCPWDREQRLPDVRGYLLEEAHELAAAVDDVLAGGEATGDWSEIVGEAGDLLFQVAFLLRLGEERGICDAGEAVRTVRRKMVARHPHVFADARAEDAAAVTRLWEARKAKERGADGSLLDGVAPTLPALLAAYRLSQKTAGVGFDWPDAAAVLDKVEEEIGELREAIASASDADRDDPRRARLADEVGDLLLALANLARKLGLDPEAALAGANRKFRRRFEQVEHKLRARGGELGEAPLDELEALWQEVKREERGEPPV